MILHQFVDYETLRLIWWLLIGILLIGFAVTDGFDLGIGTLLPFVAKTDMERRIAINTIGPIWEGNQVWLIVGGGQYSRPGHRFMRSRSRDFTLQCLRSWRR